ncbi:MAG: hypothetical protein KDE48_14005 [Anaerolineales bacterium]|nr:hypothetical protein [Anaerolineales bacterium]
MTENENWKTKTLIVGTVVGAGVGLGTAFLLTRSSENQRGGPPEISAIDLLKVAVAVIGVVRGIAALGD